MNRAVWIGRICIFRSMSIQKQSKSQWSQGPNFQKWWFPERQLGSTADGNGEGGPSRKGYISLRAFLFPAETSGTFINASFSKTKTGMSAVLIGSHCGLRRR